MLMLPHLGELWIYNLSCIHRIDIVTCNRVYMATLYWRHKKNGKWTWTRANIVHREWTADELTVYIDSVPEEEE